MEDSYISNSSWNKNVDENYSRISNSYNDEYIDPLHQVMSVLDWVTICIGLLLTLLALFAVSMMKKDQGAPIYVINLLISDLIQLCSRIPMRLHGSTFLSVFAFRLGFFATVGFMVCVSMERYLVIAKPLWYRFRNNIKTSVLVCVAVWIISLFSMLTISLTVEGQAAVTIIGVLLLLPLPLFIFFLAGSITALSEARSVPADEKRRIISILVLVLLTHVVFSLPVIISLLWEQTNENLIFYVVVFICESLIPLADSALYILLKKGAVDNLLASLCCCKMSNKKEISSTDNEYVLAVCPTPV